RYGRQPDPRHSVVKAALVVQIEGIPRAELFAEPFEQNPKLVGVKILAAQRPAFSQKESVVEIGDRGHPERRAEGDGTRDLAQQPDAVGGFDEGIRGSYLGGRLHDGMHMPIDRSRSPFRNSPQPAITGAAKSSTFYVAIDAMQIRRGGFV